jgi:hypothetical protein
LTTPATAPAPAPLPTSGGFTAMTSRPAPDPGPVPEPSPVPAPGPVPALGADWAFVPAGNDALRKPGGFVRLLGVALTVLVTDPTTWLSRSTAGLVLTLLAAVVAWFAALPLTARPVALGFHWRTRLVRHRNTAFAVLCVLLAAVNRPPDWLAACDAALLLGYLLLVDAVAAGPPGARLLRRPVALGCAFGSSGVALAAALVPVSPSGPWVRILAAVALIGAAAAVIAALGARGRR